MMRNWLFKWSGRLRLRVIQDAGVPYLERYYLGTWGGVRCYLHRFVNSDPDRGLHDHPWQWAASLVLTGHYWEEREQGRRTVRRFNWLRGSTFHRVLLPAGVSEVWTLFVHHAEHSKSWGFRAAGSSSVRSASGENRRDWWHEAPRASDHPLRSPRGNRARSASDY